MVTEFESGIGMQVYVAVEQNGREITNADENTQVMSVPVLLHTASFWEFQI